MLLSWSEIKTKKIKAPAAILPFLPPLIIKIPNKIAYAINQFGTEVINGKNLSNIGLEIVWLMKWKITKSIEYKNSVIKWDQILCKCD